MKGSKCEYQVSMLTAKVITMLQFLHDDWQLQVKYSNSNQKQYCYQGNEGTKTRVQKYHNNWWVSKQQTHQNWANTLPVYCTRHKKFFSNITLSWVKEANEDLKLISLSQANQRTKITLNYLNFDKVINIWYSNFQSFTQPQTKKQSIIAVNHRVRFLYTLLEYSVKDSRVATMKTPSQMKQKFLYFH